MTLREALQETEHVHGDGTDHKRRVILRHGDVAKEMAKKLDISMSHFVDACVLMIAEKYNVPYLPKYEYHSRERISTADRAWRKKYRRSCKEKKEVEE